MLGKAILDKDTEVPLDFFLPDVFAESLRTERRVERGIVGSGGGRDECHRDLMVTLPFHVCLPVGREGRRWVVVGIFRLDLKPLRPDEYIGTPLLAKGRRELKTTRNRVSIPPVDRKENPC